MLKLFQRKSALSELAELSKSVQTNLYTYDNVPYTEIEGYSHVDVSTMLTAIKGLNQLDLINEAVPKDLLPEVAHTTLKLWLSSSGKPIINLTETIQTLLIETVILETTIRSLESLKKPTPVQSFNIRKIKPYIINVLRTGGYLK